MLSRSDIKLIQRRLPDPQTVQVYRLEDDAVVGTVEAPFSQVRPYTRRETVQIFGPEVSKSCRIKLFVEEIGSWIVEEYQVIHAKSGWWRVDSVSLEMMDTVFVCECVPASEVQ